MEPTIIASLIGIIATTQIHISKGLQKYGIDALRPKEHRTHPVGHQRRKKISYFAGILYQYVRFWTCGADAVLRTHFE